MEKTYRAYNFEIGHTSQKFVKPFKSQKTQKIFNFLIIDNYNFAMIRLSTVLQGTENNVRYVARAIR